MENDNDWFGNLIMAYISYWLGSILGGPGSNPYFSFYWFYDWNMWFSLFGVPEFWITTMTGLNLLPADVTNWDREFN